MKRLRELEAESPLIERAQALLDAEPALPESRERMLRVRRALDERRGVFADVRQLSAAAAAGLVVMFGASAFAAVRIYVAVTADAAAERAPQSPARASEPHRTAKPERAALPQPAPEQPVPAAEPPEAAVIEPSANRDAARAPVPRTHPRVPPARVQGARAAAGEPLRVSSDSELVHRAAKALRHDRDPALAARLLESHRARSAAGPLAEEALSLEIEAAVALRSPRAGALAREYLARYPGGRYTAVAQRALAGAAP